MTEPKPILRKPPGGVTRWFLKAPVYVYRIGLGWTLGKRFAMLEHTGRRSGNKHQTVLEVIRHDSATVDLASAWGPKSDWFLNIKASPQVRISTGRNRNQPATARVADDATAAAAFAGYTEAHPRAAQALSKSVGLPLDDPDAMAASVPLVQITLDRDAGP